MIANGLSYVAGYGIRLLPVIQSKARTPLLVTVGGLEGQPKNPDRFAFEGLGERLNALKAGTLSYALVDGADHSYTGVTDRLWAAMEAWFKV